LGVGGWWGRGEEGSKENSLRTAERREAERLKSSKLCWPNGAEDMLGTR
jgi:hypothetical protein